MIIETSGTLTGGGQRKRGGMSLVTDKELEQVKNAEYVTDRYLRLIDPATLKVTGDPAK